MEIVISDPDVIKRIHELADASNQTPEQIIANAIEYYWPPPKDNPKDFWEAIRGIGSSGDPTLAERDEEILAEDVDPIRGWGAPSDDTDTTQLP